MANINKALIKHRSLVITLLDLRNAFGEEHHNLITSVLDYDHIPEHIKLIVRSRAVARLLERYKHHQTGADIVLTITSFNMSDE